MDCYGIKVGLPIVWCGEWNRCYQDGWRWEVNLGVAERTAIRLHVRTLQRHYGPRNVTIGHPMGAIYPVVSDDLIGVYVRDVEKLVYELNEWMNLWAR